MEKKPDQLNSGNTVSDKSLQVILSKLGKQTSFLKITTEGETVFLKFKRLYIKSKMQ